MFQREYLVAVYNENKELKIKLENDLRSAILKKFESEKKDLESSGNNTCDWNTLNDLQQKDGKYTVKVKIDNKSYQVKVKIHNQLNLKRYMVTIEIPKGLEYTDKNRKVLKGGVKDQITAKKLVSLKFKEVLELKVVQKKAMSMRSIVAYALGTLVLCFVVKITCQKIYSLFMKLNISKPQLPLRCGVDDLFKATINTAQS